MLAQVDVGDPVVLGRVAVRDIQILEVGLLESERGAVLSRVVQHQVQRVAGCGFGQKARRAAWPLRGLPLCVQHPRERRDEQCEEQRGK